MSEKSWTKMTEEEWEEEKKRVVKVQEAHTRDIKGKQND